MPCASRQQQHIFVLLSYNTITEGHKNTVPRAPNFSAKFIVMAALVKIYISAAMSSLHGATTLSITTLSITIYSITIRKYDIHNNDTQHNDNLCLCQVPLC